MPKRSYPLEPKSPRCISVEWSFWKYGYKDVRVLFDGQLLGTIPDKKALVAGREFALPDGSILNVKLAPSSELDVTRNGALLPGSASHPLTAVRNASHVLYFFAVLDS